MNCSSFISKFLLIAINIVFVILGFVLFVLGCIGKFKPDLILMAMAQIPGPIVSEFTQAWDISEFLGNSAILIIIVGLSLLIIGLFGCCGAMKEVSIILYIYAAVVAFLVIVQIAALIILKMHASEVETVMKGVMTRDLKEHYTNPDNGININDNGTLKIATDPHKLAWDGAQIVMKCCGAKNGSDYQGVFQGQYAFGGKQVKAVVPISCCTAIDLDDYLSQLQGESGTFNATSVASLKSCLEFADQAHTHQEGCYDAFVTTVTSSQMLFIIIILIVLAIEIISVVSACTIIRSKKDKEYTEMK